MRSALKAKVVTARGKKGNPPIVLLHGWGSSSQTWESIHSDLNREHDLIFIDLPGFGDNANADVCRLNDLLEQLVDLLPGECYLLGWSLGGMLATTLAARYPQKIKKLVTLATNPVFVASESWPTAMPLDTFREFCGDFSRNVDKTVSRFYALQAQGDQNRRQVLACLKAQQPAVVNTWQQTLALLGEIENKNTLNEILQPCLHLFGDGDALVPVETATAVERCGGRHRVDILKNTGHALHISQPRIVAKKILDHFDESPYRKNKQEIARSFSRAADRYDSVAVLQKKVAQRLITLGPRFHGDIADLGCGTGFCAEQISQRDNEIYAMDLAQGMLKTAANKRRQAARWLGGDMEQLPFASQSLDGAISSMSIQWCEDLQVVLKEIRRVLKPAGWFLFSTLGPKTLNELASAWQAIDRYIHVNRFYNDEEISRLILESGFSIERRENNIEQLYYDDVFSLMRDLKTIGAHNVNAGQNPGLTGRQKMQGLQQAYETFRDDRGRLPATYDVYYFWLSKFGD